MKRTRLSKSESAIEKALIRGEFLDVDPNEFDEIARGIAARRKDAVLNIRVNHRDLQGLKSKARRYGIRYQTLIAELIHRAARN